MGAGATCYGQSTDGLEDKCKAARSRLVALVELSGRPAVVAAPVPPPRPRPRYSESDGADGAATVTTAVATAAVATAPSLRVLIAAKIDESEAAHAAEKATLSARIAALEDEKRCAAAYNDDELAPHTIARKWETLRTLADTLTVTVRKSVHAITVQRDGDGRLGLASVRAVLDKFVGWKKWQTVLQPLSVKFESEAGVDECGLTRELFALLFDRLGDLDLFEVMSCDESSR